MRANQLTLVHFAKLRSSVGSQNPFPHRVSRLGHPRGKAHGTQVAQCLTGTSNRCLDPLFLSLLLVHLVVCQCEADLQAGRFWSQTHRCLQTLNLIRAVILSRTVSRHGRWAGVWEKELLDLVHSPAFVNNG